MKELVQHHHGLTIMNHIDPILSHNSLWALGTLVYVKTIIAICDQLVHAKILPPDVSRKLIHLAACSWCLFWPQFDVSHWSWKLNATIPFFYSIQLVVKGAILRDPKDPDVLTMSRSGNPVELLYGPFLFTLTMLFCGLETFMKPAGVYIMGTLAGDGIAPLVGKRFPVGRYTTLGGGQKTLSGSLAMFAGSVVGIWIYATFLKIPDPIDLETVLMIALVATLAEAVSGIWDNPVIACSVYWFFRATDFHIQL